MLQFANFERQQIEIPLGVLAGSIVGDAVGLHRFGFEVRCHVDRHLGEVQLLGGFPTRMADDDDAVGINDDRLPKTEFVDGLDDRSNRVVVDSRILFVRLDPIKRPHFDLHGQCPFPKGKKRKRFGRWLVGWLVGASDVVRAVCCTAVKRCEALLANS